MAAVDKTNIANLALSHLREKGFIENIETSNQSEAKNANLWYDPARRQVLVDFDLGFARKRQTLTAHANDPSDDWAFRYQYPASSIQARYIENPLGRGRPPVPFLLEQSDDGTQSILTDAEDAVLVFTRDVTDTLFFTPHFVLGFSYLLAHYMAGALTGKKSIQDDTLAKYNLMINIAGANEANVTSKGTEGWTDTNPWKR